MSRKYKILILLSLPLQLLLLNLLAGHPEWVEQFYTGFFYKQLSWFLRFAFGGIPAPVGQFVFYGLILALLYAIFNHFRKLYLKKLKLKQFLLDFGLGIVAVLSAFYFLFTVMWGLNYYRKPVPELVALDQQAITLPELESMSAKLISLTNQSRRQLTTDESKALVLPISHDQILQKAAIGFASVAENYPQLTYQQPSVKRVYVPELMSYFGISGIYFPFTGEANVNMDPPAYLLPETVCHEMAHQIGFASEDEANFIAYLTCRHHPDPAFQYSGNFMAMKYTLGRLRMEDSVAFEKHYQTLSPGVMCDLEENRNYWNKFQNPIEVLGRAIHDLFLKANNQEEGVVSYSRVVELLMGEYRKNGLEYPEPPK